MSSEKTEPTFETRLHHLGTINLGRRAVGLDMHLVEESMVDGLEIDRTAAKDLGVLLIAARSDVLQMSRSGSQVIERTFSEHAPSYIRMLTEWAAHDIAEKSDGSIDASDIELSEVLTHQKANRRYALSNRAFLNVLQWYSAHTREALKDETEVEQDYKEAYEERYTALVKEGIIPQTAAANILVLYKMLLSQDNYSDSHMGYFSKRTGAVIHSRVIDTPREKKVVFHELTHAMGSYFIEGEGDVFDNESFNRHAKKTESARIFSEGTTELITAALLSDEYRFGTYARERNLIIALCETSEGAIHGRDFVEAYFDDEKALLLVEQINQTFGPSILEQLDAPKKSSSNKDGLSTMQRVTIDLYKAWAAKQGVSKEAGAVAADRIIDAADSIVSNPQFLRESIQRR